MLSGYVTIKELINMYDKPYDYSNLYFDGLSVKGEFFDYTIEISASGDYILTRYLFDGEETYNEGSSLLAVINHIKLFERVERTKIKYKRKYKIYCGMNTYVTYSCNVRKAIQEYGFTEVVRITTMSGKFVCGGVREADGRIRVWRNE